MSESIKQRTNALAVPADGYEMTFLLNSILADLVELRTELLAAIADVTEVRTKAAASIVDVAAMRTPIAATVVDVAAIRTRSLSATLSPATLVIGTASKQVPKASKAFFAMANGTLVFKPADTAMSAMVGSIAQNKFGLWAFYIDSAGTITTSAKTADADTAAAAFLLKPAVPASVAEIGFIIVTNSGEAWDAGTDDLDKASTTVIYVDTIGSSAIPVALTATTPAALTASAPAAITATNPAALTLLA